MLRDLILSCQGWIGQQTSASKRLAPPRCNIFSHLSNEAIEFPSLQVLFYLRGPLGVVQLGQDYGGHRVLLARAELFDPADELPQVVVSYLLYYKSILPCLQAASNEGSTLCRRMRHGSPTGARASNASPVPVSMLINVSQI
jgi:hypothetical protein